MNFNSSIIVGKNKTGKTKDILFKEVAKRIEEENDLVILDYNKEYYNHFYKLLKEKDYEIKVINFNDPLKGDGWEPLANIYSNYHFYDKDKAIDLLEKVAKNIFYEENSEKDPFWCNMASNLFIGLSLILINISKTCKDHRTLSFSSIITLLNVGETKTKDNKTILRKYVETLRSQDPIYITLSSIVFAPEETKGSILSVFKMKLNQYLLKENLVNSFLFPSISEKKLNETNKKYVVFIIGNHSLDRLTNIFIEQIFTEAYDTGRKVTFILDGYDKLPTLYSIEDMINKANNSNIKLYLTSTKTIDKKIENIVEGIIITKKTSYFENDTEVDLPDLMSPIEYKVHLKETLIKEMNKLIKSK